MSALRVLVVGVVLAVGLVVAAPLSAGGAGDRVIGTVFFAGGTKIHVSAMSGPAGENPRGELVVTDFPNISLQNFEAKVTCLAVSGTTATVVGQVTSAIPAPFVSAQAHLTFTDEGSPVGLDDRIGGFVVRSTGQLPPVTSCSASPGEIPVSRGNFVVLDR